MRRRPLLVVLVALAACGGGPSPSPLDDLPGGGGAALDLDGPEAVERRRAREAARRDLPRLLPLDPGVVGWFEVRRAGRERVGAAALFVAQHQVGAGRAHHVDSVGLAEVGERGLRLWRGPDEVWLLPAGALGPEVGHAPYRAWSIDPTWDDGPEGRGRRAGLEVVEVPAGRVRAQQSDHQRTGDVAVRHHLAPGRGLVRLEVLVRQETTLRLDLLEVSPRGPPEGGYDASSPAALWRSVTSAVRRLDVDGLAALMSPALRRRERTSAWERVRDLAPGSSAREVGDDRLVERVRTEVGDLLELDVRLRARWRVDGDEATAPAFFDVPGDDGTLRSVRGEVVLRRQDDGTWRWADLRP
ncbi:MAG: hypothetical protein M9894_34085 [Planctomycetes bacterium]|nr:hypothetical protein [Planctomycetota bacterium]